MTLRLAPVFHLLSLGVLRCASLLVPRPHRREWLLEWRSELWHVRKARTPAQGISWPAEREVAAFCLGAFQDAHCLKQDSATDEPPLRAPITESAPRCILALVALVLASLSVAISLPRVREQFYQYRYRIAPNIVQLQSPAATNDTIATISVEQFRVWNERHRRLFPQFAYYQLAQQSLASAPTKWTIAHATTNLPQLLNLPIQFAANTAAIPSTTPRLILTDTVWRTQFSADPNLIGQTLRIGAQAATVIGISAPGSWQLPGNIDALLLEPDAAIPLHRSGYVLAQITPEVDFHGLGDRFRFSAPTTDGTPGDFFCSSLSRRIHGVLGFYIFSIILACLALPATTPLPLGEYRTGSRKLSWSTRLRRWSFLAAKISLLLPLVLFVSLDLAYARLCDQNTSDYIQLISAFCICLFGLRWALRDQRQRCPVCLGKLTHPARVGQPSHNFLAWNGTELICTGGHGLLHVPEIATSWYSTQRWLYLDPSWQILFADRTPTALYF
jgi:hypothetical protein